MGFGYHYTLEQQDNGWWLVRFPTIPEALTEGESEAEACVNAVDCVLVALDGYMNVGRPLPQDGAGDADSNRAILPFAATEKLAAYEIARQKVQS